MRAIRRKMSFETFERTVPVRPGWKREYYDGMARVRPSWTQVTFELSLAPRPAPRVPELSPLRPDQAPELQAAFLDSFRFAPEYADYPMKDFRKKAAAYVTGFFGDVRGTWSPASTVVNRDGQIVAAALVKDRAGKPPLLDCLLVRPSCFRQRLATAVATRAVNVLAAAGFATFRSTAMLANEVSLAWHTAFGFRELSDYFVAQSRWACAAHECERLERIGQFTDAERERLTALSEHWGAEVQRLGSLPFAQRFPDMSD
jgi:hypothetical protein